MNDLVGYYRAMARNNAWSNHRLLSACNALTQAEFDAQRVSFFPSLTETLNHILFVDQFYIDALEGHPRPFSEDKPCRTVAELTTAQSASDRRLIAFCDALTASALTRPVELIRDDRVLRDSVERALAHLFVHQIHHRGQAHAMLAGTSVAPPQLDDFLLATDAPLRAHDLAALGMREDEVWPKRQP
jgi:uncharacterized damage-inducible protein DinB